MAKKTISKRTKTSLKTRSVDAEIVADSSNLKLKDIIKTGTKSARVTKTSNPARDPSGRSKVVIEPEELSADIYDDPSGFTGIVNDVKASEVLASEALTPDVELPLLTKKAIRTETKTGSKSIATTDPLSLYLAEIRKYPLLTREEEMTLAKKYFETKDPEAAQKLVHSNLRFVVKVAAEYSKFSSKMIDLVQEGNVGLMHAVREFNPYKGARLITYAVWWIKGYIQEYLMRQYSMVRIGTTQNQRKLFYQLQKEKQQLEAMGTEPNIALLSHRLGIPEDEVSEMAQRMSGRDVSLDRPADEESTTSLADLLRKDDGTLPMDERLALEEQLEDLKTGIEKLRPELSEKELIILDERLLSDEPLTLQEIGEKYKITREAVRQTEVRVLNKIKSKLQD